MSTVNASACDVVTSRVQVLSVACGVWHTAAVAGERHSRFGILHTEEVSCFQCVTGTEGAHCKAHIGAVCTDLAMTSLTDSTRVSSAHPVPTGYMTDPDHGPDDARLGQLQSAQTATTSLREQPVQTLLLRHGRSRLIFLVSFWQTRDADLRIWYTRPMKLSGRPGLPSNPQTSDSARLLARKTGRHVANGMRINCCMSFDSRARSGGGWLAVHVGRCLHLDGAAARQEGRPHRAARQQPRLPRPRRHARPGAAHQARGDLHVVPAAGQVCSYQI